MMDDVDSSARPASASASFGSRLRRATLTLGIAIAMHVWVVPALRTGPRIVPSAPHLVQAGVLAQPQTLAVRSIPATSSLTAGVRVTTTLIDAQKLPADGPSPTDRRSTDPAPAPRANDAGLSAYAVATTGTGRTDLTGNPVVPAFLAATPVSRRDLNEPRLPEAPLDLPETRDQPDVPTAIVPAAVSSPATVAAHDRVDSSRRDEEVVRQVLQDYARAYERLDVQAAKAIYPTVDSQALQRAFEQLDAQQLAFASCGVVLTGRDANARCRGDATYRPKVGSRTLRLTAREWTFNLSRDNDRWQIVKATLH